MDSKSTASFRRFAVLLAAGAFASVFAAVGAEGERLPRENLLVYRTADGEVRPVESEQDWLARRAEIVRGMETVMGSLAGDE